MHGRRSRAISPQRARNKKLASPVEMLDERLTIWESGTPAREDSAGNRRRSDKKKKVAADNRPVEFGVAERHSPLNTWQD